MHLAQVTRWGETPIYATVSERSSPQEGQVRLKVIAAGVHNVVRSRASGKHYSAGNKLPHIPGVDGIGEKENGERVYFTTFVPGGGSLSEIVNVPAQSMIPLPAGLDPVQTAAIVNPAMSSWLALQTRVKDLSPEFSVLIIGATSASGRIAVHLARTLGAKRVIGAARDAETLAQVGVDESIVFASNPADTDFSRLCDVDVVLDYVYGPVTEQLFRSLKSTRPVQYVQIGVLSGASASIPGEILRSKDLTIRGSGPGAWSMQESAKHMPSLLQALVKVPPQPVRVAKLEDIESEWARASKERLVFTM